MLTITAAGVALGAAIGLFIATMTMTAGNVIERERCYVHAEEQLLPDDLAIELCDHRVSRLKGTRSAKPLSRRAARKIRRHGRV